MTGYVNLLRLPVHFNRARRDGLQVEECCALKILLVNKFYFPLGGPETCLFHQETLLRERGHSVIVFSTLDPRNKDCEQSPFFVEKIDYNHTDVPLRQKLRFGLRLLYSLDAARRIGALVQRERPDIAHLHNIYHQISPSILPVLRRQNVPIVQTVHDLKRVCPSYKMLAPDGICERCTGGRYYNAVRQRCVKGSLAFSTLNCLEAYLHQAIRIYDLIDLYVSPSVFYKKTLKSFGVDGRRIRVLPNFVWPDQATSSEGKGYVFYCGQLARQKGVLTLVRAVEGVDSLRLVMAGTGPEEETLRRYVGNRRMRNVEVVRFVTGERRSRLMREASLFVLPSEWYENCPLVVLEAFAYGKPVVAASIGGIPELVKPGWNGLLFPSGNASELRQQLQYLMSNPSEIHRMGRNGRQTVLQVNSPDVHYRGLMSIYQEAIARNRLRIAGRSL